MLFPATIPPTGRKGALCGSRSRALASAAIGLAAFWLAFPAFAASGSSGSLTSKQTFKSPVKAAPPVPFETTAPEFVLSGRTADLEKTVLAQTPGGPLTALDVLMFDRMTEQRLWATRLGSLLDPKSLEAESDLDAIRAAVDRLAAAKSISARAGGWNPAEDELRVMAYPAYEAAWIEGQVVPQVKIEEADIHRYYLEHANEYLRRRQAQVRYIFKRINPADSDQHTTLTAQLETVAFQVRQGARDFAQTAREMSDAASKADGGLIPPFYDAKYFPAFDQNAFNLVQAGDLSPVFDGPGGIYLLQLVQMFPTRNIPIEDVHDAIARDLTHEHIRHYYAYTLTNLKEKTIPRDFSQWWPYLNVDAPIAIVGARQLKRQDFIRFFGNPTELDLTVRWDLVGSGAKTWIEGETILRELERTGGANHRWAGRARELATIALRARRVLAAEVPPASYQTPEAAAATLNASDTLGNDFRAYHLIQFQIAPEIAKMDASGGGDGMTAADQREAEHLAERLEDQLRHGILPIDPEAIDLAQWRDDLATTPTGRAARGAAADLKGPIEKINKLTEATGWPHMKMRVTDFGWSAPLPDSPMYRLLSGVAPGGFSRTQQIGTIRQLYMVFEIRPSSTASFGLRPEVLRELAFQAGALKLRTDERDRMAAQGAIRYQF